MADCVFCEILRGDLPAHIVAESELVVTFLALEGHPLVVPKAHIEDVTGLDDRTAAEVMQQAVLQSKALQAVLECDGVNLVQANGAAAGQDVFHFHMHVKPRWRNDDVVLRWDTQPMEESEKERIAGALRAHFADGE